MRNLKIIGGILVILAVYIGAAACYVWKWEKPHLSLPAAHLEHRDHRYFVASFKHLADSANEEMIKLAKELQTVSLSGALMIDGKQIWAGSIGLADVENTIPASIDSRYRIGSVSKSLTATALARMVELGLLALDDEVQTYLPDYPRFETPMTIRQLAGHMAGIRHYEINLLEFPPHDFFLDEHFDDVISAVEVFKADELKFPPGQGFHYSTYGYTLLSAVMQQAAGMPFLDLMAKYVFDPLQMNNTQPERSSDAEGLVRFYNSDHGEYGITRDVDFSIKWAGGGFVSTPSDLVRMGYAWLTDKFIDHDTRLEFFKTQAMFDGSKNPQDYALGWRHHKTIHILGENQPVEVVHHGGKSVGGAGFLLLVPNHNISVAILSNGTGEVTRGEIQMLAYRIAALGILEM